MEKSGLFGFKAVRKCFITTLNGRRQLNAFLYHLMSAKYSSCKENMVK